MSREQRRSGRRENDEREGAGTRAARLQELIRQEVSFMFENEIRDGRLQDVRVTFVDLTADGSCARIWYSVAAASRELDNALARVAPFLRARLAESLGLKRTPEVRFRRDEATRSFANEHFTEE
jgi:ribosome-binding factor A